MHTGTFMAEPDEVRWMSQNWSRRHAPLPPQQ
jgi:hypothetical protein